MKRRLQRLNRPSAFVESKPAMTLDRLLSRYGAASRSTACEMICKGRVRVNGRVTRDPECWVRPGKDVVELDGQRLRPERKVYLLFYKPKGVIVRHGDPGAEGRFTATSETRGAGSRPSAGSTRIRPD